MTVEPKFPPNRFPDCPSCGYKMSIWEKEQYGECESCQRKNKINKQIDEYLESLKDPKVQRMLASLA